MNDSPIDWSRNKTPQPRAPSAANHGAVSSSDDVEEAMATAAAHPLRQKVEGALASGAFETARQLASLLVSFSNGRHDDALLLARAHVALQEPRQALDALKRHGCLAAPPPPALSSSSSSSSSSSPVHLNPPHVPPLSTHRPGGAPPLSSGFPNGDVGIGGGGRGAGFRGNVEGDGGHRGGPPESATPTPGLDFLMRGGGASPLGGGGVSGGNPDFSFDGDYSFSDRHPTAEQDARHIQHPSHNLNNESVDMCSPSPSAGAASPSSPSSMQIPGGGDDDDEGTVAGGVRSAGGTGGAGGDGDGDRTGAGVGREGCGWPCVVCTFVNEVDHAQCSMCTTPGPPLEERQAAEAAMVAAAQAAHARAQRGASPVPNPYLSTSTSSSSDPHHHSNHSNHSNGDRFSPVPFFGASYSATGTGLQAAAANTMKSSSSGGGGGMGSTRSSTAYSGVAGVAVASDSVSLRCHYLAAQCLATIGDDDEATEVLLAAVGGEHGAEAAADQAAQNAKRHNNHMTRQQAANANAGSGGGGCSGAQGAGTAEDEEEETSFRGGGVSSAIGGVSSAFHGVSLAEEDEKKKKATAGHNRPNTTTPKPSSSSSSSSFHDMAPPPSRTPRHSSSKTPANAHASGGAGGSGGSRRQGGLGAFPSSSTSDATAKSIVDLRACCCALLGKVLAKNDSLDRAIHWLAAALRIDPYATEAFDTLVNRHLLADDEAESLVEFLPWRLLEDDWLQALYFVRINPHCRGTGSNSDYNTSNASNTSISRAAGRSSNRSAHVGSCTVGYDASSRFAHPALKPLLGDATSSGARMSGGADGAGNDMREKESSRPPNVSLLAARAELAWYQTDAVSAHVWAKQAHELEPLGDSALAVYCCAMVELQLTSELYFVAHTAVEAHPTKGNAWFSVGCYYLAVKKYELAQRHFHKATKLDPSSPGPWVGCGHAYALMDESEQALGMYRRACRLFPGSHVPLLCMGMEYLKTTNRALAGQYLRASSRLCAHDPAVHHELGVLAFQEANYEEASQRFLRVLSLHRKPKNHHHHVKKNHTNLNESRGDGDNDDEDNDVEECDNPSFYLSSSGTAHGGGGPVSGVNLGRLLPVGCATTVFNLGQCYRKLKQWQLAARCFEATSSLEPTWSCALAALGLSLHACGDLHRAVEAYHAALALTPGDTLCQELLSKALAEAYETPLLKLDSLSSSSSSIPPPFFHNESQQYRHGSGSGGRGASGITDHFSVASLEQEIDADAARIANRMSGNSSSSALGGRYNSAAATASSTPRTNEQREQEQQRGEAQAQDLSVSMDASMDQSVDDLSAAATPGGAAGGASGAGGVFGSNRPTTRASAVAAAGGAGGFLSSHATPPPSSSSAAAAAARGVYTPATNSRGGGALFGSGGRRIGSTSGSVLRSPPSRIAPPSAGGEASGSVTRPNDGDDDQEEPSPIHGNSSGSVSGGAYGVGGNAGAKGAGDGDSEEDEESYDLDASGDMSM